MPRKTLKLRDKVEYLSILDGKGNVDESLDPDLGEQNLLQVHRLMVLTRKYDERMINLQRQGRIGTYGPCRGQEAAHCASVVVMQPNDWLAQSFREPGACIHRGWPIESLMLFWGGYEEGSEPPEGVNDLPIAVPISTQTLHAMGLAWAAKLKGNDDVVLCYCGDGATSEGDFHEAMNFAGVYRLPVVFFVQNNHWAISIPREKQTASETIAQKALAYGFGGIQIDGNDPLAVHVATTEAVDRARHGGGPTLIEAVTYRLIMHTTADDPTKYRCSEEVSRWEKLDPLPRFRKYLIQRSLLDAERAEQIEAECVAEVKAAVKRYEAARDVDPLDAFKYMYAELPQELIEQREEFRAALKREASTNGR